MTGYQSYVFVLTLRIWEQEQNNEKSVAFSFIILMDCFCSKPQLSLYRAVLPKLFFSVPFFHSLTQNFIDLFEQQSIHLLIKLSPPHQSIYPCIHLL